MKKFLLLFIVFFAAKNIKSQSIEFIENKGQWNSLATFKTSVNGNSLFLQKDGYRMLVNNGTELKAIMETVSGHAKTKSNVLQVLHSHAYEVKFKDASAQPEIVATDPLPTYNNYFIGSDKSKWAAHCKIYQSVIYKNIYEGIDVRYYATNDHFKYDFIVHSGADPKQIQLLFNGVNALALNNKDLIIKTSVGDLSELKPFTYQLKNNNKINVENAFEIAGNTVSFKLNNYDKTADLIIDPTLVFSSYVGSVADDWGYCSAYDGKGNFFAGSIALSNGFPTNLGAFQTTFHGGDGAEGSGIFNDIAIFKFNPNGTQRIYATYLGGSGDEQPQSMIADKNNNLIISGRTTSADYPITLNNYGKGGSYDISVSVLSADGSALIASRKIGGSGMDGVNIAPKYSSSFPGAISVRRNYNDDARADILTDKNGNIYLVGATRSTDFPTTVNAFKTILSGSQDGYFIKTSSDLSSIITSTYIGGNNDDAVFSINKNQLNGNIYLAGSTKSTNLSLNAADDAYGIIHKNFAGGETDGFIALLNSNGNVLKKTVYIGTPGNDMLYKLSADSVGSIYITGTTTKSFPVVNAVWKQNASKQFITKLDANLSIVQYSTNFGNGGSIPNITPIAFGIDKCDNVYVVGWGGNANSEYYPAQTVKGLSVTNDALQKQTDGNDFYIFGLGANAKKQLYGSFYGANDTNAYGDHLDGASSRFDKQGNLYLAACANCNKVGNFPTTSGVWSPTNPAQTGAQCNFAGVKIRFDFSNCTTDSLIHNGIGSYNNVVTTSAINTELFITPNPVKSIATVYFQQLNANAKMSLVNDAGKTIMQKNIPAGSASQAIHVETLSAGVYHIILITTNETYKASFLKINN